MGLRSFLERLGFVRLRDFGLILTPDRRVVTTREPLDDHGAIVVGWEDHDLAAAELEKRRATTTENANVAFRPLPPPPPPVATRLGVVKAPSAPMPAQVPAPPVPVVKPVANPFTSSTVAYPNSPPTPDTEVVSVCVTHVPSGSEDDFAKEEEWDWQIARARAMPEDPTPDPAMGASAANPFAKEPRRRVVIHQPQIAVVAPSTPRTIIPVPSLPAAVDARRILDAFHPPVVPRRTARGTRTMNEEEASTIPGRRS